MGLVDPAVEEAVAAPGKSDLEVQARWVAKDALVFPAQELG